MQRCPDIAVIKSEFVRLGAQGALMSGSGSSVFGVFGSVDEARNARQHMRTRTAWQVFQANVIA